MTAPDLPDKVREKAALAARGRTNPLTLAEGYMVEDASVAAAEVAYAAGKAASQATEAWAVPLVDAGWSLRMTTQWVESPATHEEVVAWDVALRDVPDSILRAVSAIRTDRAGRGEHRDG